MKGDFSRVTFDPGNHYTRVLMQQGRVHLDADFNEQSSIAQHYLRELARDLIGPEGGPKDPTKIDEDAEDAGFAVITDPAIAKQLGKVLAPGDFLIGRGHYYVDGAMCENPEPLLYSEQTGYPFDDATATGNLAALGDYTIYLDVWERHIAAVENPGILEPALGGPDTSTRAQLTWQVRVLPADDAAPEKDVRTLDERLARTVPLMAAQAGPPATNNDPCTVDPGARYRGLENQLYRVEIHAPGHADPTGQGATFKWSRENGSVVMPLAGVPAVDATASTTTVQLTTLGRDTDLGLVVGGWVELVDDAATLRHSSAPLLRVHSIDRDSYAVVLEGTADPLVAREPSLHPYLRRWDHDGDPAAGGALPFTEQTVDVPAWLDLEDGVQVAFAAVPGNANADYRTGDYWRIPARTATGDVQWPLDDSSGAPELLPPIGERHAYAGLSAVGPDPAGTQVPMYTELRKFFGPLAQ